MNTITAIQVPTRDQVNTESQEIFDTLKSNLGMVPNLYATIGYSSNALGSFLEFSGNAGKTSFSNKEIEAIKLAVSETNNCAYCKAAHTAIAKMNGFSHEETIQLRNASIEDAKLNLLTRFAKEISSKAGHVSEEIKEEFFSAGYNEKALIDLVSVVTAISFTNFAHALTNVPVDFPAVN